MGFPCYKCIAKSKWRLLNGSGHSLQVECFNPFSKPQVLRKEQTIRLHYVPRPDWEVARWGLRTAWCQKILEWLWRGWNDGDEAFGQRFMAKSWANIYRVRPKVMNRIWGSTCFRMKSCYPESLWGCLHCYELNVVPHCSLLTAGTPPRNKGELQHLQRRLRRWWDEFALPTGSRALVLKFQPVEIWLQRPGWCFDDVHMYTYTWIRIYLKVHWRPFLDGFRTFFRSKGVKVHQASCDLTLRVAWRNPLQMWKNSMSCWENQIHFRVQPKDEFEGEK